jgi:hypothetical protein
MQRGCLERINRKRGLGVWQFRWSRLGFNSPYNQPSRSGGVLKFKILFISGVFNDPLRNVSRGFAAGYCNFAHSALACFRMGMSGSACFRRLGSAGHCGSPTFRTNSANRGSARMGSSAKSVFNPINHQSCS